MLGQHSSPLLGKGDMKNREGEGELNTQAWVREAKDPLVQRPRGHARIQEHKREDEIHGELEKDSRKK